MKGKVLVQGLVLLACLIMLSTPNVLAGPLAGIPCNGDFNNDGNVDATDVSEFLIHFGRSIFNDPCPPPDPSGGGVPKTGQTVEYGPGDDGALEKGVAWPNPRFTDHGDTVTDNLTGLMWTKDAGLCGAGGTLAWADTYLCPGICNTPPGSCYGYNDWRVPNANEIHSLLDYGQHSPALPSGHPFLNVGGASDPAFWTSTTSPYNTTEAFVCSVSKDHNLFMRPKTYEYRVWMVRGPGASPTTSTTTTMIQDNYYNGTLCSVGDDCCCRCDCQLWGVIFYCFAGSSSSCDNDCTITGTCSSAQCIPFD